MLSQSVILEARILIVDDQQSNVLLLEQLLRDAGYQNLTSTRDPYCVCDLHRIHQFDLILLDLQMPGMDGFQVMAALNEMEVRGYAPVLALTVQPSHKLQALASGAKDFISKPFDLAEVRMRVHNMLEVRLLYKKLEKSISSLASLALHDNLTKLPNRRLLMQRLDKFRRVSASTRHHGALMFMDIDHFKQLNDTLGHDMGDELLLQVSERLLSYVREGDSVARFGGDEFVVLLEALSCNAEEAALQTEAIAHHMSHALSRTYSLNGQNYNTSLSIGIVIFSGDNEAIGDVLKKADVAMYQAKVGGRNTIRFFDSSMQTALQTHEALVEDMRRGLEMQEFELYYQIQVDGRGSPIGAEAMVRWNHPRIGLIVAPKVIQLAEKTTLILALDQWVLDAACQQLLDWSTPQTVAWTLAINVSDSQFARADFVPLVISSLQKTGANPHRLVLELSESIFTKDVQDAITKMNAIVTSGVSFSVDDFGTDLSSLTNLRRLPLNQLKIAPSFVSRMLTNDTDAVIVRFIAALGRSLGLKVIAVGVENVLQHECLANMGCTAFQGDYFGSAQPAQDLIKTVFEKRSPALTGKV